MSDSVIPQDLTAKQLELMTLQLQLDAKLDFPERDFNKNEKRLGDVDLLLHKITDVENEIALYWLTQ